MMLEAIVNRTGGAFNNSSPVSSLPLTVYVDQGSPSVIRIPVEDPDGDIVRCRNATYLECHRGMCTYYPYGVLDEENCTLSYNGNGSPGLYPIILKLEDFPQGTTQFVTSNSLGSVDLQFIVHIQESKKKNLTISVRIQGGGSSGLLQVYHNGVWGTVCDDSWTMTNTHVACRQLGFRGGISYHNNGGGSGQIWLDNVRCSGSESSIEQCRHNGWGNHNCDHSEDVVLTCYLNECRNYKVLSTSNRAQGYRGIKDKCDRNDLTKGWYRFMGDAGTAIATSCVPMRHCGTAVPGWMQGSHPTQAEGVVTRRVCYHWSNNCCNWRNNIRVRNCGGFYVYELVRTPGCNLRYCGNSTESNNTCVSSPCRNGGTCRDTYDGYNCTCPYGYTGRQCETNFLSDVVRIQGGGSSGLLQVFHNRVWGTVCDDYWGITNSHVVCRQLGFAGALSHSTIRGGSGQIWLDDVKCIGNESSIQQCSHNGWGKHDCDHNEDISVACYEHECRNYTELSTSDRGQGYRGIKNKCDRNDLTGQGWYRFVGDAGSAIATSCVPMRHCGTAAPGWMQGSHPNQAEGVVTRRVCYHWDNNCCNRSINIRVKNCGGFFVYELVKTPDCYLRYCGNSTESNNTCVSSPCRNGGTCRDTYDGYNCTCPFGYTGRQCETRFSNSCPSFPCLNGGTCYYNGYYGYRCNCPYGYTGRQCETNVNPCNSNPCRNRGTCQSGYGWYRCTCPYGYTGRQCETNPPKILVPPVSQTSVETKAVTLTCYLEGKPKSTVTWLKDGTPITPDNRMSVSQPISASNTTTTITIANLNRTDEGNYSCKAVNDVGTTTSSSAVLTVNYHSVIFKNPQTQTKQEGQQMVMWCEVEGKPVPDVTWKKDGVVVVNGGRITINNPSVMGRTNSTLEITNLVKGDEGTYTCKVNNTVNTVVSLPGTGRLTVIYAVDSENNCWQISVSVNYTVGPSTITVTQNEANIIMNQVLSHGRSQLTCSGLSLQLLKVTITTPENRYSISGSFGVIYGDMNHNQKQTAQFCLKRSAAIFNNIVLRPDYYTSPLKGKYWADRAALANYQDSICCLNGSVLVNGVCDSLAECNNYTVLNASDRAQGQHSDNVHKCDTSITKGWYRFMGDAGSAIATSCVSEYNCGTRYPGWMNSSHPTQAEGPVTRRVCVNDRGSCCYYKINIRVRNCGGFYVYELDRVPFCDLRYCGNGTGMNITCDRPCLNGATCLGSRCYCPNGYTGRQCESSMNITCDRPCLNGATCLGSRCYCPTGYSGRQCESSMNITCDRPCLNGATCFGSRCYCPNGYTGRQCESSMNITCDRPCLNGATCLGSRCYCPTGYTGRQCESSLTRCNSSPCLNGGACHGNRYWYSCKCQPGYSGRHCETNLRTSVTCGENYMQIELKDQYFTDIDWRNFHLKEQSCRATKTYNTIRLRTTLDGCGTTYIENEVKKTITFWNEVRPDNRYKSSLNGSINDITGERNLIMPFYCVYERSRLVSTNFSPSKKTVTASEGSYGNFTFTMDLYHTSQYRTPYSPLAYPVVVYPNQPLWVQYQVKNTNSDLVVFAENCRATTSTNPNSSPQHVILQRGCIRDSTMVYSYDPHSRVQRFSIRSFRFVYSSTFLVYLHCELIVCHRNTTNSRCARGCISSRRRRETVDMDGSKPYDLSAGPLKGYKMNANSRNQEGTSKSLIGGLGAIGGIFFLVSILLSVIVYRRRGQVNKPTNIAMDVTVNSYEQDGVDRDEKNDSQI